MGKKICFKKKPYYEATSEYVNVKFFTSKNDTLYIKAKFFDVTKISGIHIHTNYNGSSGPIVVWLATTPEWDHGVTQNTPLTNSTPTYACCIVNNCKCNNKCIKEDNNMCTLVAPEKTPYMNDLSYTTQYYTIDKKVCPSCPWISDGTFLDIHGKNFQQIYGCKIVGTTPGIDMLESIPFVKINN